MSRTSTGSGGRSSARALRPRPATTPSAPPRAADPEGRPALPAGGAIQRTDGVARAATVGGAAAAPQASVAARDEPGQQQPSHSPDHGSAPRLDGIASAEPHSGATPAPAPARQPTRSADAPARTCAAGTRGIHRGSGTRYDTSAPTSPSDGSSNAPPRPRRPLPLDPSADIHLTSAATPPPRHPTRSGSAAIPPTQPHPSPDSTTNLDSRAEPGTGAVVPAGHAAARATTVGGVAAAPAPRPTAGAGALSPQPPGRSARGADVDQGLVPVQRVGAGSPMSRAQEHGAASAPTCVGLPGPGLRLRGRSRAPRHVELCGRRPC